MTFDGWEFDEERLCFLFEEERGERTYILTEAVPFEADSAAGIARAFAARRLAVRPPVIVWFDDAPDGDFEQMRRDELPVFRKDPVRGFAFARIALIGIYARQRLSDVVETVAHETFHAAGHSDEATAVHFGQHIREILMPLIHWTGKPYIDLAAA